MMATQSADDVLSLHHVFNKNLTTIDALSRAPISQPIAATVRGSQYIHKHYYPNTLTKGRRMDILGPYNVQEREKNLYV